VDNVIFDLSDYYIILLNDLTWPDQLFILSIIDKISNRYTKVKKLYIVHNWMNIKKSTFNDHFEKYIKNLILEE